MNFQQRSLKDFQAQHKNKQPDKAQMSRAKKEVAKAAKQHKNKQPKHKHERLPHGSQISSVYDSEKQSWAGTMSIPIAGGVTKLFTDTANAVFHLLYKLDQQYRKWLKTQPVNSADSVKKT